MWISRVSLSLFSVVDWHEEDPSREQAKAKRVLQAVHMEDSKFQINDPPNYIRRKLHTKMRPTKTNKQRNKQTKAWIDHTTLCFLAFPFSSLLRFSFLPFHHHESHYPPPLSLSLSPCAFVFLTVPIHQQFRSLFESKSRLKIGVRFKERTTFIWLLFTAIQRASY